MSPLPKPTWPPIALGMLSMVLGSIGLLLFFLPILGLPISVIGLLIGGLGIAARLSSGGRLLRWSLQGCGISALAMAVNLAIICAPYGYMEPPLVPPPWQPVSDRPYNPPPARPGFAR